MLRDELRGFRRAGYDEDLIVTYAIAIGSVRFVFEIDKELRAICTAPQPLLLRCAAVLPHRVVGAVDHANAPHRVTVIVLRGRVQHRARRTRRWRIGRCGIVSGIDDKRYHRGDRNYPE